MTAATVVSTCSLKVMSLTSRLFLAMRICRALTPGPKPCNRCWLRLKVSDEVVAGLKSLRGLLLFTEVLFNPRLTVVPVRKDCWIPKLPTFWDWISSLVPVVKALLCGVVKWPQLKAPVSAGSRLGMAGPEEVMALAPTALEEALLEIAPALLLVPAVVPELETVALEGPLSENTESWVVEVSLTAVSKNSPTACCIGRSPRSRRRYSYGKLPLGVTLFILSISLISQGAATGPTSNDCLACHSDKSLTAKRGGRTVSLFVDQKKFTGSMHGSLQCTNCHADLDGKDLPHSTPLARVNCGSCHSDEAQLYAKSLHGRAVARGDSLAPRCVTCHGNHDILPVKDPRSSVAAMKVPFVCGQCHREGTPVQTNRNIPEHDILENYSESIHGEALLKKGLIVTANCASCHTAHSILPHTDPNSSIARRNIAATCTKCHANIELVHRKTIRGELWEKQANSLPACVDCHQPHKIRNVFYSQGMADADCMRCHANASLKSLDGRSMLVRVSEVAGSRHLKVACSQCHSEVNASRVRPCETITHPVDCTSCHAEVGQQYQLSTHGQMHAKG